MSPRRLSVLEEIVETSRLAETTRIRYAAAARDFVDHAGARKSAWTQETVKTWYAGLLKQMTPQSANQKLYALRHISRRYARQEKDKTKDFARGVDAAMSEAKPDDRVLTPAQVGRLIAACAGSAPGDQRDLALVSVALCTGIERAALAGIDFDDIEDGHVRAVVKGSREELHKLSRGARAALTTWMGWLETRGVTHGAVFRSLSRATIAKDMHVYDRITEDGIYKALKKRAEAANIRDFHPRLLRATFLTKHVD